MRSSFVRYQEKMGHKIQHLHACERDFFVRGIPRIRHFFEPISRKSFEYPHKKIFRVVKFLAKYSIPRYKTYFAFEDTSSNDVLYLGLQHFCEKFDESKGVLYMGFLAQRNLSHKQNVLFYGPLIELLCNSDQFWNVNWSITDY